MYSGPASASTDPQRQAYAGMIPTPISNGRIGIPQMLDEQQGSLSHLHEALMELEKRLALVLGVMPAMENTKPLPPSSSQIVDRLQEHDSSIREARARVTSLIERLQL